MGEEEREKGRGKEERGKGREKERIRPRGKVTMDGCFRT